MGWRWCLDNTIVPALGSLFPQRRKLFLSLFWMSLPVRSSGGWRIRSGAPLYGPLQAIEGKIYATGGLSVSGAISAAMTMIAKKVELQQEEIEQAHSAWVRLA